MSKVWSFVKLDLRLMKAYYKSVLIIAGLGVAMGIGLKSGETLASYTIVMLALLMSYPFVVSDKNNLNVLYGTLPVSRKHAVIGRYLFALLFTAAGAAFSLLGSWILTLAFGQPYVFTDSFLTVCLSTAFFWVVVGIQYPLYFKLGYTKAKIWGMVPLVLIFGAVLLVPLLSNLLGYEISPAGMFAGLRNAPVVSILSFLGGGLALLCLSCYISYRLYRNKDI